MAKYPVKYKGTKAYLLVYCALIHAAKNKTIVSYSDVAKIMGLPPTGNYTGKEIGILLGEISEEEVNNKRPMLTALAVSKNAPYPSEGFFVLAKQLGIFKGEGEKEEKQFWEETREAVYSTWADLIFFYEVWS